MKRLIAIVLLAAFAAGMGSPESKAAGRKVNSGDMADLVREYNLYQGFDVVSVGGLGLGLVKMIAKASTESEEDKKALAVLDGLKKVIVVDYEAADQGHKESFGRKVDKILKNAEKIIEVKDDGDAVNVYGTAASEGERIDDLIVFIPEDCTLICLFGSISADKIADIIEMNK